MGDVFLAELEHEIISTRKTLERVPEEKFGWAPHEKSMKLGRLAGHVAEIPMWAKMTMEHDSIDMAPANGPGWQPLNPKTRKEVLEAFDANVKSARAALSGVSDEHMGKSWTLLSGGKTVFSMPRAAVFRNFVMNHLIHHRAQLGVYLRLNNVLVPSVYGPSADEGQM